MKTYRYLITGSRGFVGQHLVAELFKRGHVIYKFNRGDSFPKEKVDVVFHLADNSLIRVVAKDPNLAKENYNITSDVLEWMRKTGTKKIVFTSSREVYSLENLYGMAKKQSEDTILMYAKLYGIKYAIVRMVNLYGIGDHKDRFIPTVIRQARQNKDITIFGNHKVLNFVYIDDCVSALIKASRMNGIFNLNSSKAVTLKSVAETIVSLTNSKSKIIVNLAKEAESKQYQPRVTPFKLKVSLEEGLRKIC